MVNIIRVTLDVQFKEQLNIPPQKPDFIPPEVGFFLCG